MAGDGRAGMVACRMVIGLSATPQRFEALLAGATGLTRRGVTVAPEQTRDSGLLKQRVLIFAPIVGNVRARVPARRRRSAGRHRRQHPRAGHTRQHREEEHPEYQSQPPEPAASDEAAAA